MREGSFTERLAIGVTLKIAGKEHEIAGGAVKRVELELEPFGFSGELEFVLQDDAAHGGGFTDELREGFLSQEPLDVRVALAVVYDQAESAESPEALVLSGLVTRRSVVELPGWRLPDRPLLVRRYRIAFTDPARALWTQHFPCRLHTHQKLEDVIRAQIGDKIKVKFGWAELAQERPLIFLHLPVEHGASFYDFLIWYADHRGGLFTYDYVTGELDLLSEWPAAGEPRGLFGDDIAGVEMVVPPTPAHAVEVCNTYANGPRTEAIAQTYAESAIRHDHLMHTSISQEVDDRVALEKQRLRLPKLEVELTFGRMPVIRLLPGDRVQMAAANRWNKTSALVGKIWRVRQVSLRALASDGSLDHDLQLASTEYEVSLRARLVDGEDTRACHPEYRRPRYPGYVEGKVVSEKGEDSDKTYQVYRNDDSSLDEYTVEVPAWSQQKVTAPFIPYLGSGNVYVPAYRGERVLLALDLHHARVARLLEWREGAALSMDVQGEHILLGKSPKSSTSINHVYEDDKPVLNVARTSDKDTGLIRISEGTLVLRVEEMKG
ncbi:hypothetical protein [Nannocystis bainbridge]|uniref:Gp5/Type VI secretion system Vgr protein OB-fold domain-containing protein n=1 Tax=Nannocystis bainbridge TaxID=2995303 RepID=A0ABT5ECG2_9BACT|nr:hypothetical protein [Nannocystis bainbridge]MDC0723562.1 hypothetical protein [Nannocystis bainbridge]